MKHLIFLLTLTLCLSCKKDAVVDRAPELLSKSWKMTAWDVITPLQGTPLAGQSSNWYTPGCYSNMLWTYEKNGDLIIKEDSSCIPSGTTGIAYSKWILVNNNKKISISGYPFGSFIYNIISLTETKLVVQRSENVGYGGGVINLVLQREYTAQ